MPPGDDLTEQGLIAAKLVGTRGAQCLGEHAGEKVELYRKSRAALELIAGQKTRLREENLQLLEIAVQQHVFPGNKNIVENENRIVLVEARGQGIIERRSHHAPGHFVGGGAEEVYPGGVHRREGTN